ncbi:MAG: DJ-1/PfpI family protein [Candidatus Micrarchaeota archaeon]
MAKVLMIIAQKGYKEEELQVPKRIIEGAGHHVKVASLTRMKAVGTRGTEVQPDLAVSEANPDFFDCIVIVGGPGSPSLAESKDVMDLLIAARKKDKQLAAICLGPMALAKSGALTDKKATVFPDRSAIMLLRDSGAQYVQEPVVADTKVITADSPASAEEFGKRLVELLKKR